MGRCKNCRWWGRDWEGVCDFVNTIMADEDTATMFVVEATAADDTGLEAVLKTGPEFGCIHFNPELFDDDDRNEEADDENG